MGEKVETKNEVENKAAGGVENKAADGGDYKAAAAVEGGGKTYYEPITVVLKLDMHCEGCAKKVRRSISQFNGVEKVKAECHAKKLTVTGNKIDPNWIRERVESMTKKKVELISPQPQMDGGAGGAAVEKKAEEKRADENEKPKEAVVSTVVMKARLHCDGCANKIKRFILKNVHGVQSVTTKLQNDTVTVIGTMDVKELITYLKEKLKRSVEIVPPKKANDGGDKKANEGGGDKKEKEGDVSSAGASEGEKKEKESSGGDSGEKRESEAKGPNGVGEGNKDDEVAKVEVNKMEHRSDNPHTYYAMPMYNQSYANQDYRVPMYHHQDYSSTSHVVKYTHGPPTPPPTYLDTNDYMFSDENPNGCFVM